MSKSRNVSCKLSLLVCSKGITNAEGAFSPPVNVAAQSIGNVVREHYEFRLHLL